MNTEKVTHVFGALNTLEKTVKVSEKMIKDNHIKSNGIDSAIFQQKKFLSEMRRAANKLQLEICKKDFAGAARSYQTFYGLNSIVRPEILTTYRIVANQEKVEEVYAKKVNKRVLH